MKNNSITLLDVLNDLDSSIIDDAEKPSEFDEEAMADANPNEV